MSFSSQHSAGDRPLVIRAARALALGWVVALCAAALSAAPASAAGGYANLCPALGLPSFCAGDHNWAFDVAVDNSAGAKAGDVYLTNLGIEEPSGVSRFTSSGEPDAFTGTNPNISANKLIFPGEPGDVGAVGVAVDSATGEFYVTVRESNKLEKFTSAGEPAGSFSLPGTTVGVGVTVDDSAGPSKGDVYVADEGNHVVYKFEPNGTLLNTNTVDPEHPITPYTLAVDAGGHVYASNPGAKVQRFSEELVFEEEVGETNSRSVAIDPSNGNIFIAYGDGTIQEYSSAGTPIGSPFGALNESYGIAVSGVGGSIHNLYAANERPAHGGNGVIFGEGEGPETPTTGAASEITGNTAKLEGTVNPGGSSEVGYHFAYNTTGVCEGDGSTAPVPPALRNNEAVSSEATGLSPRTEYTFCLVASNNFGFAAGLPATFMTGAGAPVVASESSSGIGTTIATVEASINPSGAETTCKVEYGQSSVAEAQTECAAPLPEGTSPQSVSVNLTGLEANKTYKYRFSATNSVKTVEGEERTFTTKPLVEVETGEATGVTAESATLNGIVTTGPVAAEYYFEYATGEEAFKKTPPHTIGAGEEGEHPVSSGSEVSGLTPGVIYRYRLLAATEGVPAIEGEIKEFTTLVAKPKLTNRPPISISRTSARLSGELDPGNGASTYYIEYGLEAPAYGASGSPKPEAHMLARVGPEAVEAQTLSELHAATTYHYRIVAHNAAGTTQGPDATFTTNSAQLPLVSSGAASSITQTTATINGSINPNGLQTTFILELGTDTSYGTPTFGDVGSATEAQPLAFSFSNLLPGSTYHYRLVAVNEDGTVPGADVTFITPGFPSPIVEPAHPVLIGFTPPKEASTTTTTGRSKPLTRAQKLARALRACKKKPKRKRAACIRQARRRHGAKTRKSPNADRSVR